MLIAYKVNVYLAAQVGCSCAVSKKEREDISPAWRLDMECCTSCGSELPGAAQFCGYCGRVVITVKEMPTSMSGHPAVNAVENYMPPSISGSSQTVHGSLRSGVYSSTGSIWSKGE